MLFVGMVLGIVVGHSAAVGSGLDPARTYAAMILLTIPGLVGARLLYVATRWSSYREEPRRIWKRSEGGAGMLGGLPAMLLVSIPLLGVLDIPLAPFWDAASFTLIIGMGFARVGCFLNGCCSGRASDSCFALRLPDHEGTWRRRIPTQALEAGLSALLFVGAALFWPHRPFPGALLLATVAAYSFSRVVLEPLRASQYRLGVLNAHRSFAFGLGVLASAGLVGVWVTTA